MRAWLDYDPIAVELALWERRWSDAAEAVRDAATVTAGDALDVQLAAGSLRARVEEITP